MKKNNTLEDLFSRIVAYDDQKAFEELFFDFYPSLCVFAQRFISSPEACEDIVQDTFFHLWKNRKQIKVVTSFKNLLITTVKNNCIDYLRKQSVRETHTERQIVQQSTNISETPEVIYSIRELEEMLDNALQQLPDNARRAFELSRFENLTYNQIAKEMALSPKTIEAYISRVLSMLRVELKDYLPLILLALTLRID